MSLQQGQLSNDDDDQNHLSYYTFKHFKDFCALKFKHFKDVCALKFSHIRSELYTYFFKNFEKTNFELFKKLFFKTFVD